MKPSVASRLLRTLLTATFAGCLLLTPAAAWAVCGDGNLEEPEECDDANSVDDDCCSNECKAAPVESFCTDGNQCTFDFCDGFGFCSSFPNQQGECDDGNACTVGDFCNSDGFCTSDGTLEDGSFCGDDSLCGGGGQCFSGFCFGDPVDCQGFGVCNSAVCNPETGSCEVTQLEDDTPCDNPNPCTDPGVCRNGECEQPPTDCSDFADACNDAFCDVEGGGCISVWKENGTECDDTNGCTNPGTCDDGECITTPKDCSAFADQCNDAACDEKTVEGCFSAPKDDGTECNDEIVCTTADVCTEGSCGGTPVDCSESGDDCNIGFCNPESGECDTTPVEVPTDCDDGDPCTTGDMCRGSVCAGGELVDCSNFDTACTTGVCNVQTGECEAVPNQDGGECDDGDRCTLGDECVAGECTGTPLDCSESGDQCNTGFCNGDTGGCESDPIEEPVSCDDDSPCTENDTCSGGECVGTPKDCSEFDTACATGACGRAGDCIAVPNEDGDLCDDGNKCTTDDHCVQGECNGTPLDCSGSGDQCNTGVCNGDTGGCESVPVEEPAACNDGNLCTSGDTCSDGTCAGTPKDCSGSDGNCIVGECNPETGQCVGEPAEDGTSCSDGNLCTTADVCTGGVCGGTTTDCSNLDDDCNTGSCNTSTGGCVAVPRPNGTGCSDGNLCTTADVCTGGVCGGTTTDCSSLDNACNTGSCNTSTGGCVAVPRPNGTDCSDSNLCTTSDVCTGGVCGGTTTDCSNLDNACNTGSCNTSTGGCVAVPRPNGTGCSDGNLCTTADVCTSGVCGGTTTDCSNLDNDCNTGSCNTSTGGCVAVPRLNGTGCSDGNLCTTSDVCTGGVCGGTTTDCSNLDNACNTGSCNTSTGGCVAVPRPNGTGCSDGNLCTTSDVCTGGVCGGTTTDCSNLDNACNTGSCNTNTGGCVAVPRPNGTGCSDGNPCTAGDACTAGSCTSGAPKDCSGLDAPCKSGVCNPQSGLCEAANAANNSPCNDGAFCTATDRCNDGVCIGTGDSCPGTLVCNGQCNEAADTCNAPLGTACESDGNPCTDDVCDGQGNCVSEANESPCDDGLFCTTGDHCADKACIGDPACPQTSACGDTCDEANDACRTCGHPFSNSRCIVNAIFVLQGALGLRECELCTCDVDSNGRVTATDALMILRTCTNLPVALECPPGASTTTTSAAITSEAGCEAGLHNMTFKRKYTCAQSDEGGDPVCAGLNEQHTIRFTHFGGGVYLVRDVPDTGVVRNGLYDCSTFTWSGGNPAEHSEGGFWTFSEDETSFSGSSVYDAVDQSYAGGCNETGAASPAVPPDPEPIAPCE